MAKRALADADSPRTPKKAKTDTPRAHSKTQLYNDTTTPTHLRSILKPTPSKDEPIEKSTHINGRVLFAQNSRKDTPTTTIRAARNDASARKKSAAILQNQAETASHDGSDAAEDDLALARQILSDEEEEESQDDGEAVQAVVKEEPAKRRPGRPKGSRRARTPTPPPDMPAQEMYFFHNRTTASKTSANVLPANLLLNHEDHLAQIKTHQDPHAQYIKRLEEFHHRSFEQWRLEMDEYFSICLYGYGSKRRLMLSFAEYLYGTISSSSKIIVVNGYLQSLTIKDVLSILAGQLLSKTTKPPNQPVPLLEAVMRALDRHNHRIYLVVHNLDSLSLRKPVIQVLLARLASHKNLCLIASCDNINFGLLWDLNLLRQYNFVFHDATTFEPWSVELDTVEEINLLLGRSSRRLTGKDGVGYVLRSLPENARNLFKILVTEQLTLEIEFEPNFADEDGNDEDIIGASDEELAAAQETPSRRGRGKKAKQKTKTASKNTAVEGVDYRALYHKAVEEFVCSSEVNFRTLLKEFHDHQMIVSRKDPMGTERLIVPFRREELEAILEEL